MGNATVWTVSQFTLLAAVMAVFGLIGIRRGIRRELIVLGAFLFGIAIAGVATDALVGPVNRLSYLQRFARMGGLAAEDPSMVWEQVRSVPELIRTPGSRAALKVALFGLIALLAYVAGTRFTPEPEGAFVHILGLPVGLLNGLLAAYFFVPVFFSEETAVIQLPSGQIQQTLEGDTLQLQLLVILVVVLLAYGLYSAAWRVRGAQ